MSEGVATKPLLLLHTHLNMSLSSYGTDPLPYSYSPPLRRSSKPTNEGSPATATSVSSSFDHGESVDDAFWANLRHRELAGIGAEGYKPAHSASHEQIRLAVLEFIRREKKSSRDEFPAVLVATKAKRIPLYSSTSLQDLRDVDVGKIKFFLDHHGSLFIVSLSAKGVHGTGVNCIIRAMNAFDDAFSHFLVHDDIVQEVPGGTKAPDAALKLRLPSFRMDGPLRAPFIAEIRSSSYSTDPSSELVVSSEYMRTQYADYFLYLFVEKKRANGLFPAAAVLWRRGAQSAPLTDGQHATFLSAQSFGTGELDDDTKTCLRNGGGHYPGVPAGVSLDVVQNPANVVVPKADILRKVMRADGSLHYQRRQGPGNIPVVDAMGSPVFDFPADGPDLVISLQRLKLILDESFD